MAPGLLAPPRRSARSARGEDFALQSGDHLAAGEFLRRFEQMPGTKKAELIHGVVYMPSPVRFSQHGRPDNLLQTWLGHYAIHVPDVEAAANTTLKLSPESIPQPDALLRLSSEAGGRSREDADGYLAGAPELVAEIAASSASLDATEKVRLYQAAGIREYLLWRTSDEVIDWLILEDGEYQRLSPGADGLLRSRVFPGLWLDAEAMLAEDGRAVMAALQRGLDSISGRDDGEGCPAA